MVRVMLADRDPAIISRLAAPLIDLGYRVFGATAGDEAEEVFRTEALDLVLLSMRLGPSSGLDLLEVTDPATPALKVIKESADRLQELIESLLILGDNYPAGMPTAAEMYLAFRLLASPLNRKPLRSGGSFSDIQ